MIHDSDFFFFFHLFQGQCILSTNISVNKPPLATGLFSIRSLQTGVTVKMLFSLFFSILLFSGVTFEHSVGIAACDVAKPVSVNGKYVQNILST